MTRQLFAGISVSDYPVALEWYERLLGQPPSFSPNDVESVWDVNESGWVHVEHRHQHAGHEHLAQDPPTPAAETILDALDLSAQ